MLPESDQAKFGEEIITIARGCAAVRDFGPFLDRFLAWQDLAKNSTTGEPLTEEDWDAEAEAFGEESREWADASLSIAAWQ